MLDEQHRDAAVGADLADELAELADLVMVEAAGRLVEEEELRLAGERAGELDALLRAERQAGDRPARPPLEIEIGDELACAGARAPSSPRRTQGKPQRVADDSRCGSANGRRSSRSRARSGAGNSARFWKVRPMPSSAMRWAGRSRIERPSNRMSPAARRVEARQAIEQRGLAGAVRADEAEDLPRLEIEGHAVERHDAAEAHGDVANRQKRRSRRGNSLGRRLHQRSPAACAGCPDRRHVTARARSPGASSMASSGRSRRDRLPRS